jgi:hypothetical protein
MGEHNLAIEENSSLRLIPPDGGDTYPFVECESDSRLGGAAAGARGTRAEVRSEPRKAALEAEKKRERN